jgi:hypothetical protein
MRFPIYAREYVLSSAQIAALGGREFLERLWNLTQERDGEDD